MPDQSTASTEHALLQEITAPLATLPDNPVPSVANVEFPIALRGYDRLAVDAYVKRTSQLVAELQATRSPEAAVRRALERVGEEVSGILQRAHETGSTITAQSRTDAEDRLDAAREEAAELTAGAERRLKELDAETDRIWAERHRIVEDAQELARQLLLLAESATDRFPPAEDLEPVADDPGAEDPLDEPAAPALEAVEHPFDAESEGDSESDLLHESEATAIMPPITPDEDHSH
jgi:cell division septum initiation protein DivIVA